MTDEHTPSHEEIYEMAVQDKAASGAPEVVYLCETSAESFGLPADVNDLKYIRADLAEPTTKTATLDEIRAAVGRGDVSPASAHSPEADLPDGFWDGAEKVPPLSPVVSVKPIQWDKHPDDDEWYALLSDSNYGPEMGYIITKTVKGNYRLHMRSGDEKVGKYPTFDAATNAATEHQRTYILSQVEAQPPSGPVVKVKPLAWEHMHTTSGGMRSYKAPSPHAPPAGGPNCGCFVVHETEENYWKLDTNDGLKSHDGDWQSAMAWVQGIHDAAVMALIEAQPTPPSEGA